MDLDYFYAQVEEVENPSIKTRPVVVCVFSGRTEDSGVVSTANYVARGLGVKSGMPIATAKRKLEGREPVIIRMEHAKYEVVSDRVMQLIRKEVDVIEQTGIDEAFIDLSAASGGDFNVARGIAERIKESLLEEEHLTCSVGIGRSKVVAKIGSDFSKPNGLTLVLPNSTRAFLAPLPVISLYGVGPKTAAILAELGIKMIGDINESRVPSLEGRLGRKAAAYLFEASSGLDKDPVLANQEPTQFSRVMTLKRDTKDSVEVMQEIDEAIDDLCQKLKKTGRSFRNISAIGILTDLTIKTKSRTFDTPINDPVIVRATALELFGELAGSVTKEFRRTGLRISGLSRTADQKSLSEFVGTSG